MRTINRIVIHHSDSPAATTTRDKIYKWHVEENGWDDIGYHWLIAEDGYIEPARPFRTVGAHAYGRNKDSLGYCLFGDFNKGKPTDAQYNTLNDNLKALCNMPMGIQHAKGIKFADNITIEAHRDPKKEGDGKPCPGRKFDWSKVINPWDTKTTDIAARIVDNAGFQAAIKSLEVKVAFLAKENSRLKDVCADRYDFYEGKENRIMKIIEEEEPGFETI